MFRVTVTHGNQAYSVPHVSHVPFTLAEGKEIVIQGVTSHHANNFLVSLSVGRDHNSETPFCFNPRFDQNEVVRNHNSNGWGSEEKHGGFPFYKGSPYEIKIVVRHHGYQVFVNNNYFCDFNHRLSKESVRHLYIEGDTSVNRISFFDVVSCPNVPFHIPVHGEVHPGREFVITGVPTGQERFNVNLLCGGHNIDHHDVALTFDVRFNFSNCYNEVVRTHKAGGGWGAEEKHQSYFPFSANVPFEIVILVEHHGFKISVNNQHFVDFNHRIHPIQRISHLSVDGQVRLTQVKV
ncbi:hypothetical protein BsWGS_15366 [Bradybaena similaris]